MPRFCTTCGTLITESDRFCTNCGNKSEVTVPNMLGQSTPAALGISWSKIALRALVVVGVALGGWLYLDSGPITSFGPVEWSMQGCALDQRGGWWPHRFTLT